jgi:hypothetical protein
LHKQLLERRTNLLKAICIGVPLKTAINKIAEEYKVKEKLLYRDWERRKSWLPLVVQLRDQTLINEIAMGIQQAREHAWTIIARYEKQPAIQLGALKVVMDTNKAMIQLLQDLGTVEKQKLQLEGTLEIRGEWWKPKDATEPK